MAARDKMREITFQEISQSINNNIEGADNLRMDGLTHLLKIRKAKETQQIRKLNRIREKYGADDPRNDVLKMKLSQNERMVGELKREEIRMQTVVPEVDPHSWVVYGYVRNQKLQPLAGLILGLYQADNTFLEQIGTVTTDKQGYFEFRYKSRKISTSDSTGTLDTRLEKLAIKSLRKQRITSPVAVCIHVMDKDKKRLYLDKRSLIPRAGAVDYRDIVIPARISQVSEKITRYLGNSNTRELHDLNNEKTGCRISSIRFDHKVDFAGKEDAVKAGYDYCAYCFGKEKSKR